MLSKPKLFYGECFGEPAEFLSPEIEAICQAAHERGECFIVRYPLRDDTDCRGSFVSKTRVACSDRGLRVSVVRIDMFSFAVGPVLFAGDSE